MSALLAVRQLTVRFGGSTEPGTTALLVRTSKAGATFSTVMEVGPVTGGASSKPISPLAPTVTTISSLSVELASALALAGVTPIVTSGAAARARRRDGVRVSLDAEALTSSFGAASVVDVRCSASIEPAPAGSSEYGSV